MNEASGIRSASEDGRRFTRRPSGIAAVVLGAAALIGTAVAAHGGIGDVEVRLFRAINDLPGALYPIVWVPMQFGAFIAIPVVSLVAAAFRRWRLAAAMAVSGLSAYYAAQLLKEIVERARPADVLADVHVRGAAVLTLGFPSGHAAVAAGLAIAASAYVTRRIRNVGIAVAVVVAFARVYVGAHFPLDVIGGAALGATVASVVHLVLGVPRRSRANREGP